MGKRILLGLFLVTFMSWATSCQKYDKTGKDFMTEIIHNFNEGLRQAEILGSADDSRVFFKGVDSAEEAWADCATWIYEDYNGGEATFVLPDDMGTVKAVEITDEDGAYIYVYFKLNKTEEVVLRYLHPNYIDDDNVLIRQPGPWDSDGQTAL